LRDSLLVLRPGVERRWHDREKRLAITSKHLAQANDVISRYVASQLADQIRAGNYAALERASTPGKRASVRSDRAHGSSTPIGRQVNLAARLQAQCEPDRILLSHSTFTLVQEDVACTPKGEISVKGFHQPVKIYEVIRSA
jgi:hypothetical protein